VIDEAGLKETYEAAMREALGTAGSLPAPGSHYLLPFGARSRFLFKMDFAETEYICRVRSGIKGHFSYRDIAWRMKCKMEDEELGRRPGQLRWKTAGAIQLPGGVATTEPDHSAEAASGPSPKAIMNS
jgi:hypothetical protein